MPLECFSQQETSPEGILRQIEGFKSPFFTYDEKGVHFWNLANGQVQGSLKSLGITDNSQESCTRLFHLDDQQIRKHFLSQSHPFGSTCEFVLNINNVANPEGRFLFPNMERPFERTRWNEQFVQDPQNIKWFNIRFGGNFGYIYNVVPNLMNRKFDSVIRNANVGGNYLTASIEVLKQKDAYTIGHMQRVGILATKIFEELLSMNIDPSLFPYSEEDVPVFKQSAFLHDIGKINIPDSILLRDRRVHSEELIIIRKTIAALLQDILISKIQSDEISKHDIPAILKENTEELESIMKEIERINRFEKLKSKNYEFLEQLSTRGFFSDNNLETNNALILCENRLNIQYGNLLPWEIKLIQSHSGTSWKIMKQIDNLFPGTALHHLNYSVPGYPPKCELFELFMAHGIDFPTPQEKFQGHIVQAADMFDAAVTKRPYSPAKSPFVVLEDMKENTGTQFHPLVVEAFIRIFLRDQDADFKLIVETFQIGGAQIIPKDEW